MAGGISNGDAFECPAPSESSGITNRGEEGNEGSEEATFEGTETGVAMSESSGIKNEGEEGNEGSEEATFEGTGTGVAMSERSGIMKDGVEGSSA
jgi:hypothetical protein